MIRLFLGLLGTLAIAGLSDVVPLDPPPRPVAWCAVLAAAAAAFTGSKALSRVLAPRPASPPWPLRWVGVAVHLGAYAAVLYPLGWARWVLVDLRWRGDDFGALLGLLAPAAVIVLWLAPWAYYFERRTAERLVAAKSFPLWLLDGSRPILAVALAFLGVAWVAGRLEAIPPIGEAMALHRSFDVALASMGLLVLFVASPYLVLLGWPSAAFPDGDRWDRLSTLAARSRLRRGSIRIWDDRTLPILNACVVGLVPWTRRVFFTRGMHDLLEPADIEAVLSHELGHVRKGHLGLHAIAAGSFLLSLAPMDRATASLPAWVSGSILLAYGAAYWIFFFGAVSRWLEIEADFAGAESVGQDSYAAALARVGAYLGPAARRDGWRHFSLEKRLCFLEASRRDPAVRAATVRRFRSFRGAVLLLAALSAGGFAATVAMDLDRPHEEIAIESARIALGQAEDLRALVDVPDDAAGGSPAIRERLARSKEDIEAAYRARLDRALHHLRAIGADGSAAARRLLEAAEGQATVSPTGDGR